MIYFARIWGRENNSTDGIDKRIVAYAHGDNEQEALNDIYKRYRCVSASVCGFGLPLLLATANQAIASCVW